MMDVVGLGFCCADDLLLLSEIPGPDGRAVIRRRETAGGGMVATAMVAVARLGGRAGFVGKVGDDARGNWIRTDFQTFGVDVSRMVVQVGATSHQTVVLVDERTGARSFLSARGNLEEVQPEDLDGHYLTRSAILHLSDASPAALQAARWAKEAGMQVGFDGTHFHPSLWSLMPLVDYLIVSRFFASEFTAHRTGRGIGRTAQGFASLPNSGTASRRGQEHAKEAQGASGGHIDALHPNEEAPAERGERLLGIARQLRAYGPPVVVVTEGEHGSWCASPEGDFHTPAYPAPRVRDTTGAGDVFHGAFLFGQAKRWNLRRSLHVASATASLKCRELGGRAGIPTLDEVMHVIGR